MSATARAGSIDAQARRDFETQGYLVVVDVLGPDEVAACRNEVRRLHQLYVELKKTNSPDLHYFQIEPCSEITENPEGLPVLRKIEPVTRLSDVFRQLPDNPRLLDVVEQFLGPDLLLFRSTLMLKPPYHGSAHGLHHDAAHWMLEPPISMTVSIALDDATPENGCFQVMPGSHEWEMGPKSKIKRAAGTGLTDREDIDLSKLRHVPLTAGSALFFHSRLLHGSGANESPQSRNTALYAYFPPDVHLKKDDNTPDEQDFRVVRGLNGAETLTIRKA